MNTIKNKLNIVGKCFVKENSQGGEILSFIPDVPFSGFLDHYLFILNVPSDNQKFAPAFMRLQSKDVFDQTPSNTEKEFKEVRSVGYIKDSRRSDGELIVVAPKNHIFVDFSRLVLIATLPSENRVSAPAYFRIKTYEKSKTELKGEEPNIIIDNSSDMSSEQVEQIMKDIEE